MQVIQTSGNKTFNVIPRVFTVGDLTVTITSESTNTPVSVVSASSINGNFLQFASVFGTLVEGQFYILNVSNGSEIIYKDKVFCTNQTINQTSNDYYTINKNQYVSEDSASNEYIII
tara:strand:+ start:145 stop:495 length:351 start_codon:yes stop_codon:yes gene_type:complete